MDEAIHYWETLWLLYLPPLPVYKLWYLMWTQSLICLVQISRYVGELILPRNVIKVHICWFRSRGIWPFASPKNSVEHFSYLKINCSHPRQMYWASNNVEGTLLDMVENAKMNKSVFCPKEEFYRPIFLYIDPSQSQFSGMEAVASLRTQGLSSVHWLNKWLNRRTGVLIKMFPILVSNHNKSFLASSQSDSNCLN